MRLEAVTAQTPPALRELQAPTPLASLRGWLLWRFVQRPGETKPRKIPYYASGAKRHGIQGRPEDRAELVTFAEARAACEARGFHGVGFAPMPEWRITALDFDACVDERGRIDPTVEDMVAGTYAELSPSGRGVRAFIRGALGNHKSLADDQQFGFETFDSKGFVTFTGAVLGICRQFDAVDTLAEANARVRDLVTARFGRQSVEQASPAEPLGVRPELLDEALDALDPDMGYSDWLRVGMALHHETRGEGFAVWDAWSARSSRYPSPEVLAQHWESFGRQKGAQVTVRSLVHMANASGAHLSLQEALDASAFDDLTVGEPPAAVAGLRFPFVPVGEFVAAAPMRYWIKGVVPQAPLVVVYGETGSGKTFAVLDLVLAVARGVDWRERRTRQGRVAYIAAEGAGGLRKRLQAYADFHGVDTASLQLVMLAAAPNFLIAAEVADVIRGVQAAGGADLIVVDTLAQVTPGGNENAGEDMGRALAHCRQLNARTGATVVLVHHAGKDSSRGARGWSGLKAAADAEVEVVRDGDLRMLRLTKAKDDIDGSQWGFRLNQIAVGTDEDGDPITSCVVEPSEATVAPGKRTPAGNVQRIAQRLVDDYIALGGEGIPYDDLVAGTVSEMPQDEGKRDQRAARVRRAIASMQSDGLITIADMRVSPKR